MDFFIYVIICMSFNFGQGNYGSAQLHTTLCQMAFLLGLTHSLIQKKVKEEDVSLRKG
jgi:hypothetical protein